MPIPVPFPTSVDGVTGTGDDNIANLWSTYKDVLTPMMKGAERPTMQFVMMCILIFRCRVMNYLRLLIIWTSICHVALMESMQSILNYWVPIYWLTFSANVCPVSL